MKKFLKVLLSLGLILALPLGAASCKKGGEDTIVVGASSTPHAEILEFVREDLLEEGFKLDIRVYDDYVLPNKSLEEGDLDANYFQHTPYLDNFNEENKTHIVSVGKIHYEPFGVFGKNVSKEDFENTKTGRTILVPGDGTNCTRALMTLKDCGYLTLKEGFSAFDALSDKDIEDSKGNEVVLVEASNLPAQLKNADDGTIAVINGNYAIEAGLRLSEALAVEDASGEAAQVYANIVAVKEGAEESAKTTALLKVLKTKKVYDFITSHFEGAVLPAFTV